jgi:hypothetical protein
VVVSFCSTSDLALLKNTNEKHSYIPVKMGGGGHRPVIECNRHNWCSVGVTTSFPHHSFVYIQYIAVECCPRGSPNRAVCVYELFVVDNSIT